MAFIQLHPDDNVAVAAKDLVQGDSVEVPAGTIAILEQIPFGHKFALSLIPEGTAISKYGYPIGRALYAIRPGEHVHEHNCVSNRDTQLPPDFADLDGIQTRLKEANRQKSDVRGQLQVSLMGYQREDGSVGVRNHVLVLPTVQCANGVVESIGHSVTEVVTIPHIYGCSQIGPDLDQTGRVLEAFAGHPNVGATLLISLGCETLPAEEIAVRLSLQGKLVKILTIQKEGGSRKTHKKGVGIAQELVQEMEARKREAIPISKLTIGLECGGSDAWSGVTANPAVGIASDIVVALGGTAILSEVSEIIGAEHLLAARAVRDEVAKQILQVVKRRLDMVKEQGLDLYGAQPTPGNIAGGITTIEEKSLGAVAKAGSSPILEVLEYGRKPTKSGLVIMDTAGNDPESVTGMVAGGAQLVVFTTGRGSPTGCPIAPTIKVASNSPMYRRLRDDMDINAGSVLEGELLAEVGKRIFEEIVEVANGKATAAEKWGHHEFSIETLGQRV